MLIGVPGSGKSTWVENQDWAKNCVYVSTDQYVEAYAKGLGKTYNEVLRLLENFFLSLAVPVLQPEPHSAPGF